MKKKIFLLPCFAAVAIASFVGAKTFKSNAEECNDLLMASVEAMSSCEVTAKAQKMGCYSLVNAFERTLVNNN